MYMYLYILVGFVVAAALSRTMIPHILFISKQKRLYDEPDQRKQHLAPIPRLGGVTFMPALIIALSVVSACSFVFGEGLAVYQLIQLFALLAGMTLLFMTGLTDDLVQVSYRKKFLIQILCASTLPLSGLSIQNLYGLFGVGHIPVWMAAGLTILLTVFITNAINLIDGVDGLASGLMILCCSYLTLLFVLEGHWFYATIAGSTVGVLIPFYSYNVFGTVERGTKIFMGDTGSLTIGFLVSFLTVAYTGNHDAERIIENPLLIGFSLLMVPCLDVLRVMLHRAKKGRPMFLPDRSHIHHKLIDAGLSPRNTVATLIMLSCFYLVANFLLQFVMNVHLLIFLDILSWTLLNMALTHYIWKRQRFTNISNSSIS